MPQSAILFSSFRGPAGSTPVGAANRQGAMIPAYFGRPGATYYVDETLGSDTQANAGNPFTPFATLAAAQAAAVAGDTIYITGTIHLTSTLVLAKDNIAYIGLNAPSQNSRARLSSSGSTVFTPMVSVTSQGCTFENIATFYGYASATAQVCWAEAGGRNFYKNVLFGGGGNATAAAQAGCRSLTIAGNGENLFEDCTFGLDTVARATAINATLEFLGGVQRNKFIRPIFQMYSSLAGNLHIKAATGAVDRSQYMYDAIFENAVDSGATAISACVSWATDAGGNLMLAGVPMNVGGTKIATAGPVYVTMPVPNTGAGIAVKAT